MMIQHEKTREVTREDVDRAIDVIERHLEKEARTVQAAGPRHGCGAPRHDVERIA
jgi:hypothetical protein